MTEVRGSSKSAAEAAVPRIGTVVDKFSIVRELGQGGMGAVYEARHATLSRRFAIKFLLPGAASNADAVRRFENEAKAAGGLEHPNLVAVTDFGRDTQGLPYLVMEYLVGEDCARLIGRLGPLPAARAANIVLQACRGLGVAHRAGIIHRDLKPANLFLTDAGDGSDLVKVLDFGIAKLKATDASGTTTGTGTGQTFGTAHYMSPEQARGAGEVDARTDVWSLGVVLYELLAGRRPFEDGTFLHVVYQILSSEAPRIGTLRPGLAPELMAVVERAMAKDLNDRFPSVGTLAEALVPFGAAGRSAGIVQRSQGLAATMATPATGLRPVGAERSFSALAPGLGTATDATGDGRSPRSQRADLLGGAPIDRDATGAASRASSPPPTRRSSATKAVMVIIGVAAVGAVAAVVSLSRGSGSGAANQTRAEAARVAPASPPPAVAPAVVPVPPVAAPAARAVAPPEPAAARQDREPSAAGARRKSPRTVPERSEHRPNGSAPPLARESAAALAPSIGPPSSPNAASAPASGSPGHPIKIDEDSPYAR